MVELVDNRLGTAQAFRLLMEAEWFGGDITDVTITTDAAEKTHKKELVA